MQPKSTIEEIRARFDADVERFSNLETGQTATMDAALALELIAQTAAAVTPGARHVLDLGCGAGNYTLKQLQSLPNLDCTLVDLSQPMLTRAQERVSAATSGTVTTLQTDLRKLDLLSESVDIVLAAAVLHHLREESEWEAVFATLYAALRPGGALWIFDLVEHSDATVQKLQWQRYGEYLRSFKNDTYREQVFAYIAKEDTPRPLLWQCSLLARVGFSRVDILHKNGPFAAFGAIK
ncbi:class I SAM-dependent methyltransferase [Armatimonas sp.]|uniref:class I SAM-dependent methyltransferase n=1 Tax=Armatimonas sp. TaxID=1872638 RepID=UPI00286A5224|nr:class I SAM-dependent methyltransferase [Armatimonas sp.]